MRPFFRANENVSAYPLFPAKKTILSRSIFMTAPSQVLKIRRPDDWHLHFRDGDMLKTVVPYTSEFMVAPLSCRTLYRRSPRLTRLLLIASAFLMRTRRTRLYAINDLLLNGYAGSQRVERGFNEGVFTAAKLYPANATTNSTHGVTSIDAIMPVLERMEKLGMPLLVHGEVTHAEIDIFDREPAL
jgi:dihydroorotase